MLEALGPTSLSVFAALGGLSVLALAVTLFKVIQFNRLGVGTTAKAERIISNWLGGQPEEAMREAALRDSVLGRVLHAVLSALRARPSDSAYAEELGRQTALVELGAMTARMRLLEMVVQAAPMLGLLGTVVGMIQAFSALSEGGGGVIDPAALADGIWTSLATTAAGLAISLLAYFIVTWLEGRIETERLAIETLVSVAVHGRIDPRAAA
jgi:biopolymer transport protein ExbB